MAEVENTKLLQLHISQGPHSPRTMVNNQDGKNEQDHSNPWGSLGSSADTWDKEGGKNERITKQEKDDQNH